MYTKKLITVLFYNSKKKYWEQPNNMRIVICTIVHPTDGWSRLQGICQNLSLKAYRLLIKIIYIFLKSSKI